MSNRRPSAPCYGRRSRSPCPGRRPDHDSLSKTGWTRLPPKDGAGMRIVKYRREAREPVMPAKNVSKGFTVEERAAMRARAKELRARPRSAKVDGESAVLAAIAAMPQPYRGMAERLHACIKASAPGLTPKTWYGMPAYAKDGDVICYFRGGDKFKERYMTLGFNDTANLDEGHLWPVAFALTEVSGAEETRIGALVKKAVS